VLYIEQLGSGVPDAKVSVVELRETLGLSESQVRLYTRFLGLDTIAVAREQELSDLLVAAGGQALAGIDPSSVRHVIHAYTLQYTPPPGRRLLDKVLRELGLGHASAFGVTHQNCVAGLYALEVSRTLLQGAPEDAKILVLTGDRIPEREVHTIPDTTIMGEAVSACVVGKDTRGHRVIGSSTHVFGKFYQCLALSDELNLEYKKFYPEGLTGVMRRVMSDTGYEGNDIAAVLPHNVNRMSWKKVLTDLGIPSDRIYLDNVPKLGHCFTADPFINLRSARESGRVRRGDIVLMVGAGLGATFTATIVEIGEGVPG